ncbi:hypothetical protein MUO93_05940 [Candidatus Bathyarchaeota archaeon]|nr:hypothetical protein [Candidatus Bathyarchaeota archaeon]
MDYVTGMSLLLLSISAVIFYWFARFTVKLIKQHYNIYPLLYELEEEKKKQRDG